MPRINPIEVAPTAEALAERHALALAAIDYAATNAREAAAYGAPSTRSYRLDLDAALADYHRRHAARFNKDREMRTVDPDPRPMDGHVFAELAAEHLSGRLVVVDARRFLDFDDAPEVPQ